MRIPELLVQDDGSAENDGVCVDVSVKVPLDDFENNAVAEIHDVGERLAHAVAAREVEIVAEGLAHTVAEKEVDNDAEPLL